MESTVDTAGLTARIWDVAVVGAGPAGATAARHAAAAGASTILIDRHELPRYKRCGGGLIAASLAELPPGFPLVARDRIDKVTFSHDLLQPRTRRSATPLLTMVDRATFDCALTTAAVASGADLCTSVTFTSVQDDGEVTVLRTSAGDVRARSVVAADGSASRLATHVGARFVQVDLGLEVELHVDDRQRGRWAGHMWLDFGKLPGAYAWVFPKTDTLTVGVIAARGNSRAERAYLDDFMLGLGLTGLDADHEGGHLTRVRTADSPLSRGRVLLAGDAAGLLEPWTREGISSALRSGRIAGREAARVATAATPAEVLGCTAAYAAAVTAELGAEIDAGRRLLTAFEHRPWLSHRLISTPLGWRAFTGVTSRGRGLDRYVDNPLVRTALRIAS